MATSVKHNILCLHQNAELYGSDRSFLSVVKYLDLQPDIFIKIVLPCKGPLVNELLAIGITPIIIQGGVIRKKELRSNPFRFAGSTIRSALKIRKLMAEADIIYVNTIVYLSAYLAGTTFSSHKHRWAHIREIPSPFVSRLFLTLFTLGRFQRIYNSFQTRLAFRDTCAAVVYNGVSGPLRGCVPTENLVLRLLLLGRISEWKGHKFAMKAIEKYLSNPKVVELIIVGDSFHGYEHFIDDLKELAGQCRFQTYFHSFTNDPSNHYMNCDLVLVPSTSPEPFGRVAIEAFSYGRPVIASNHGGLTEIVTHEETGYLFEPNNPQSLAENIQKYLDSDIKKRQIISFNARKRYEKLFCEDQYTATIKKILLNEDCCYVGVDHE